MSGLFKIDDIESLYSSFHSVDEILACLREDKNHWLLSPYESEKKDIFEKLKASYGLIKSIEEFLISQRDFHHHGSFYLKLDSLVLYPDLLAIDILPEKEKVPLTHKEAKLLRLLMEKYPEHASREEINHFVWQGAKISPRSIDCHISRLRKRIEGAELDVTCVYGQGYLLSR